MEFSFTRLEMTASVGSDRPDPYALFAAARSFPDFFSRAASSPGAVEEVFGQRISSDPEEVRKHQKPPLPFVFDLPVLAQTPGDRATISLGLTLVGGAATFLPLFISSVSAMLASPRLSGSLVSVCSRGFSGEEVPLSSSGAPLILSAGDFLFESPGIDGIRLTLETPLRLAREGRTLQRFEFPIFFMTLLRRLSSLSACYCGAPLDVDYRRLGELSREAELDAVRSGIRCIRQGGQPGLLGVAELTGNLGELYPLLRLGSFFHCGKQASYGFGKFRVEG